MFISNSGAEGNLQSYNLYVFISVFRFGIKMRMFLLVMYRIGRDRMYYCSFEHFEHAHYWRNQASVVGYYTLLLDVDMSHVMPPLGPCIDGEMGGCVWPDCMVRLQ